MNSSYPTEYQHTLYPITAIHGSASSGALWKKLREQCLTERSVFSPTLSGYDGQDYTQSTNPPSLEERAAPIIDKILRWGLQIHLVAHSFGGSVALEIVKKIPKNIKSLTLFEPIVPALLRKSEQAEDLRLLGDLISLSEIVDGTAGFVGMESFINFWHEPDAWEKLPQAAQEKLAKLAPVVYQDFREAYRVDTKTYSKINYKGPVHIMIGNNTNNHARRMADLTGLCFANTTIETLPDLGHMGPLTHPDIVNKAILNQINFVELFDNPENRVQHPLMRKSA